MSTVTFEPEVEVTPDLADDVDHIACDCRPLVTLCGKFDDSGFIDDPIDGGECEECYRTYLAVGCPNRTRRAA